jgi:DNA gyrase/topoisomerase IV subunit A
MITKEYITTKGALFVTERFKERIPTLDGLIHPQRIVFYEMLINGKTKRPIEACVSHAQAISSSRHGAINLQSVAKNMTVKKFSLFLGYGTFPTKLDDGSHARYIHIKLNDKIVNLFFNEIDNNELRAKQTFKGKEVEPHYYKPTIPLLLLFGQQQIGVGYSVNVFPRRIEDIIENMERLLKGEQAQRMPIVVPHYDCEILTDFGKEKDKQSRWEVRGKFEWVSDDELLITEIPFVTKVETVMDNIVKLKREGIVEKFFEGSQENDIHIEVTLTEKGKARFKGVDKRKQLELLKLVRFTSETFRFVHENKLYMNVNEIDYMKDWLEIRLGIVQERINYLIERIKQRIFKAQSIALVLYFQTHNVYELTGAETKSDLIKLLDSINPSKTKNSSSLNKDSTFDELMRVGCFQLDYLFGNQGRITPNVEETKNTQSDYEYIINIKLLMFTKEEMFKHINLVKQLQKELDYYLKTTPTDEILVELNRIKSELI